MTRQTYERATRLTKLATAHISKGGNATLLFEPRRDLRDYIFTLGVCVFVSGGGGGAPHTHGHRESYKDLNLKKT